MVLALFLSQFRQMHPMLRLALCGAIVALLLLSRVHDRALGRMGAS